MHTPDITHRDNFYWMLGALVALLGGSAVLNEFSSAAHASPLVTLGVNIILVVAVWSLYTAYRWQRQRLGLSLIIIAVGVADYYFDLVQLDAVNLALTLLFLLAAIWVSARQVLFSGDVNGNIITGAIVLYLLMGLAWAITYLLVEQSRPGSINGLPGTGWRDNLQAAIYFSFVTLSTLGYGDIQPVQPLARFLAYLEAITGQFFLAVLVASLVGASISARINSKNHGDR